MPPASIAPADQPDLLARRDVAFYVNTDIARPSTYGVMAGIEIYFGPDKPLVRRHREDDPPDPLSAAASAWDSPANEPNNTASGYQTVIDELASHAP